MRLEQQYRLLYRQFGDDDAHPGLPALAALLNCSERNVRLQLGKMQAQGWIAWQPGRGRGRRSTLRCLQSPEALALHSVGRLLAQGELEQAFARLPAAQRGQLMAQLPRYLGAGNNRRQLRIPIHRQLITLDPLTVSSRLEAHLVRQLFDRLCDFDVHSQTLQPALAHAWEPQEQARRWRFWLRPGISFHDGTPLDAAAIAASIRRLDSPASMWRRQYRGLRAIRVHDALSLSFELAD
ncbi:SgrR family transcriptional regulator, partial [Vogesella oryzae]|uniref:SgrR family transcriptional regulator n=1 Tax=Vogesella oryzae TaxID=1735285 RepID=UPI0015813C39